jgi:hypothetical protein
MSHARQCRGPHPARGDPGVGARLLDLRELRFELLPEGRELPGIGDDLPGIDLDVRPGPARPRGDEPHVSKRQLPPGHVPPHGLRNAHVSNAHVALSKRHGRVIPQPVSDATAQSGNGTPAPAQVSKIVGQFGLLKTSQSCGASSAGLLLHRGLATGQLDANSFRFERHSVPAL